MVVIFHLFIILCCISMLVASSIDPLDEWGRKAYKICAREVKRETLKLKKKGADKMPTLGLCETFQELVEDVFDTQANQMGGAVERATSEIFKTSLDPFFEEVGKSILQQVAEWVAHKRISDEDRVRRRLSSQLGGYMLKVAAEDKNMQNVGRIEPEMEDQF